MPPSSFSPILPPMLTPAQKATLRLARTPRIGPVTYRRLITRYGTAEEIIERWPHIAKNGHILASLGDIEKELELTGKAGGWLITIEDDAYPQVLKHLADSPLTLSGLGSVRALSTRHIGIVGTRNASLAGTQWVEDLSHTLAKTGLTITSGLARGMDGAAHKGALKAAGLTVAVLGGGADSLYPPEHTKLREQITEGGGAIISEQPWGTPPRAELFPRRNRIIAGLSEAVVVAEASRHSGSLITAQYALEYGKEVFAVPGNPTDPRAAGPNWLLKNGATLTENAQDILDALPAHAPAHLSSRLPGTNDRIQNPPSLFQGIPYSQLSTPNPHLETPGSQLIDLLSPQGVELDDLIRETGQKETALMAELTELELMGQAQRTPDGRWQKA
ncbi:MAG: DNA-protecting protein DprA [Alphaproteobacteria bacterium CG_4_10_14_0_8_um_filter_53_9]|nr:MAG: DNA-protecting protein DprA [Alphaproteobacteria bacterium CG_4_10_14_0_8_um_filter_53_9]